MTNRIAVTLELPDETVAVLRQDAKREGMDLSTAVSVAVIAGAHEPAQAMRVALDFAERRRTAKPTKSDRFLTF
jgi:hypothetical protein